MRRDRQRSEPRHDMKEANRYPENAPGPFYVEDDLCFKCWAPGAVAPNLVGKNERHCFFRKQTIAGSPRLKIPMQSSKFGLFSLYPLFNLFVFLDSFTRYGGSSRDYWRASACIA